MEKTKKMKTIGRQQMEFMSGLEPLKNTQNFELDIIAQEVKEISSFQRLYFQNTSNGNIPSFYQPSLTIVTVSEKRR